MMLKVSVCDKLGIRSESYATIYEQLDARKRVLPLSKPCVLEDVSCEVVDTMILLKGVR